jgi:hypothetical protein
MIRMKHEAAPGQLCPKKLLPTKVVVVQEQKVFITKIGICKIICREMRKFERSNS